MDRTPTQRRPDLDLRLGSLALSLVLSVWLVAGNDKINPDGPLYLDSAARILAGDWAAAYQLYPWPFYSAFVATAGLVTGWSLETSALVLNAALAALLVYAFVTLAQDLGADRKTLALAAFVILSFPYLNENRPEVIRDLGYWAFYVLGAVRFLRFLRRPTPRNALAWSLVTLAATLFRTEGLLFLVLLPCLLWLQGDWTARQRLRGFLVTQAPLALLALAALAVFVADPALSRFSGRLLEPLHRLGDFWDAASNGLEHKAELLRSQVLEPTGGSYAEYAGKSAMTLLVGGLVGLVCVKLLKLLTPAYALLPLFRRFRTRLPLPGDGVRVLTALALINGGILLVFVVGTFYLSTRFLMPLALTLLPVVPFLLASAHDVWQQRETAPRSYRWLLAVLALALVALTLDGLVSTAPDKRYLKDAGIWLREHTSPSARIYTNDYLIHYYSGHAIDWQARDSYGLPPPATTDHYDYAAIERKRGKLDPQLQQVLDEWPMEAVTDFHNERDDGVRIYRLGSE